MAEPARPIDLFEGLEYRQTLEAELRAYLRAGGKLARLSDKTGLCTGTISRLAYGETLRPRMHTVAALFEAFGYRVQVIKAEPSRMTREGIRAVSRA